MAALAGLSREFRWLPAPSGIRPDLRLEPSRGRRVPAARDRRARRRDASRRPPVPVGQEPPGRAEARDPPPDGGARHRLGRHRPSRRRPHVVATVTRHRAGDRGHEDEDPSQLRGPHGRGRHPADHRDLAEGRPADRGRLLHRLLADPPVRRGLGPRPDAPDHRGGRLARGPRRPARSCTSPRTRPARTRTTSGRCTRPRSRRAPSASASATRSATRRPTASATSSASWRGLVAEVNPEVKVDWHGHHDRGLGVTNALWALEAGAHRVHGCALGIGERVGNAPMDQLLVNLQLLGWIDRDLTQLHDYCAAVSERHRRPDPRQLSRRRPRRVPHRHRRPRRGDHQGPQEGRRVAGRPRLLRRPRRHGRPHAGHRDRPDERALQRPVLAREPRHRAAARARRGRSSAAPRRATGSSPTRRSWRVVARPAPPRHVDEKSTVRSRRSTVRPGRRTSSRDTFRLISITSRSRRAFAARASSAYRTRPGAFGAWLEKSRLAAGKARREDLSPVHPGAQGAGALLALDGEGAFGAARLLRVRGRAPRITETTPRRISSTRRPGSRCRRRCRRKRSRPCSQAPDCGKPLGLRDRAMLELMYASGLRVTEIVLLERDRVDLGDGILRVTGKGSRDRLVPFGRSAGEVARALPGRGSARPRHEGLGAPLSDPPRPADDAAAFLAAHRRLRPPSRNPLAPDARIACATASRRTCSSTARTCAPSR